MRYHEIIEATNPRPKVFYRGSTPGDTRRIRTGEDDWDNLLFVSSNRDSALMYGKHIEVVTPKPGAKILYFGTKEFISIAKGLKPQTMSLLNFSREVVRRAAEAGYDAVWFQRQGDVGTAIINPDQFERRPEE